jgi:hypothetical protein
LNVAGTLNAAGDVGIKGPDPWRDFTQYMVYDGKPVYCSSTNYSDPNTTGTISSTSHSLTLSSAIDFQNGCGITVFGAGPTSTLVMPSSCTGSVSGSSGTITATCAGGHYLAPGFGNGSLQGVTVTGCSNSAYDFGPTPITSIPNTTTFTYTDGALNSTTTGCTFTFLMDWGHGVTGSVT